MESRSTLKTVDRTAGLKRSKPQRSFALWLLILGGLIISWFGWLRLQQTLAGRELIQALSLQNHTAFLVGSGAAYGLLGLSAALALWLRWKWAPWYYPLAFFAASLLYWVEHTLLVVSPAAQANLPFEIGMNALLFLITLVFLAHPKQMCYFGTTLVNPFARKGDHAKQSGK
jgi:uncharacterized membrane protein (DUF2068 family)